MITGGATPRLVEKRKLEAKSMLQRALSAASSSQAAAQAAASSNVSINARSSNPISRKNWGINYGAPSSSQLNIPQRPQQPTAAQGNPSGFNSFMNAISTQESGGNYGAVGVPTKYGTALGRYQVLDSNIAGPGGWDMEALGREITAQEYLRTPKLQDQIARAKLKDYFQTYGPEGAAKAWYAGPGNADSHSTSPQYGGPSIQGYANSVLSHMLESNR